MINIKALFLRTSFWIKDFIKGSPIGKHYRELNRIEKVPMYSERLKEERLQDLLKYAIENTAFYKGRKCRLSDFPVVNKRILIDNADKIRVPEDKNPYQPKNMKYHIQKTSGSTGTPFAIPQDYRKRMRRIAELKYFGKIVGFNSHDSLIHLRIWTKWQSKTKKQIIKENIYPFDISNMSDHRLAELIRLIQEKKAVCIRGYASSFDIIAKYVEKNPTKFPHLKIAIAGSETLFDSTRELVEKNLNCNIISQYANEENGILAQEKVGDKNKRFFLNNSGYIFEILKLDSDEPAEFGEIGRIVITDLFNYAFPVIRYDNGDTCILDKDNTTGELYISKLFGRRLDLVYNTNEEPVFPMVMARILKNYNGIIQWQFVQKSKTEYTIKLCVSDLFNKDKDDSDIIKEFISIFGNDSVIDIEYTDDIPVLQSGKRKSVVNLMKL